METQDIRIDRDGAEPIYRQIRRGLERILAVQEPGTALPSEHALSRTLGVHRATVRQAMKDLEVAGFINRVPGKGIFSAKRLRTGIELVAFHCKPSSFSDDPRGLSGQILETLQSAVHPDQETLRAQVLVPPLPSVADYVRELNARHVRGVFFLGFEAEHLSFMAETAAQICAVGLMKACPGIAMDFVKPDRATRLHAILEEQFRSGKRRFACMSTRADHPAYAEVVAAFREFMKAHDLELNPGDIVIDRTPAYGEMLARHDRPEVIVACIQGLARGLIMAAMENGIELEREIKIITYVGAPEEAEDIAALATRIVLDIPGTAREALRLFRQRIAQHPEREDASTQPLPRRAGARGAAKYEDREPA